MTHPLTLKFFMTYTSITLPETRANRIRRLIYRSAYTGMQETDRILGGFSRGFLADADDGMLDDYERLLDYGDVAIWSWVSGRVAIPLDIAKNPALRRLLIWCEGRHD